MEIFIIVLALCGLIIYGIVGSKKNEEEDTNWNRKQENNNEQIESWLQQYSSNNCKELILDSEHVYGSKIYACFDLEQRIIHIWYDYFDVGDSKRWLSDINNSKYDIRFDEIIKCELAINNKIIGASAGDLLIGGIIGGGIGIAIAANNKKEKTESVKLNITTKNISNPLVCMEMINPKAVQFDDTVKIIVDFAEQFVATINSIVFNNNADEKIVKEDNE